MKNSRCRLLQLLVFSSVLLGFSCSEKISPSATAAPTSTVNTQSIRHLNILSWNIYMLPPGIYIKTGKLKRARIIGDILAKSDYDVIVFQEAFHPSARAILVDKLEARYPYRVGPVNPSKGIKTSSGIWIWSKYPMKLLGTTEYTKTEGFDNGMARKGAGMVEVTVGQQRFHIIGTHLNAGGDISVRFSQLWQISDDLVSKYANDSIPLIVCGDMNINCYELEYYNAMISILEAEDCIAGGLPRCPTSNVPENDLNPNDGLEVIDYFFFRLPARFRTSCDVPVIQRQWSKKHKSLSDHEPVSMEITW